MIKKKKAPKQIKKIEYIVPLSYVLKYKENRIKGKIKRNRENVLSLVLF